MSYDYETTKEFSMQRIRGRIKCKAVKKIINGGGNNWMVATMNERLMAQDDVCQWKDFFLYKMRFRLTLGE